MFRYFLSALTVLGVSIGNAHAAETPNILLILTDDLGYGDPVCYNAESKIPTPNIDRLARGGMRFTDAHAPAAVCVPTRYGLLTGRYPFRTRIDWRRRAVIEAGRMTLGSLLSEAGYATACVGKWHLGFDGGPDYDYTQPLPGGPVDRGFAHYFGIPHSLDIEPYYYIRGDKAARPPTEKIGASSSPDWSPIQGKFWRSGNIAPGFVHKEVLPRLAEESIAWLEERAGKEQPFFLYLALTSPHTPWLPAEKYRGKSGAGLYGDFVMHTDAVVGQVLQALDRLKLKDDTLVLFTNDNGPIWYQRDIERFGHRANLELRGMKGDAWEGGHRVPFLARWPGRVKPGSVSGEMICQTDLLATFAALVDRKLPPDAGEDSFNILPALLGESGAEPIRPSMITQSSHRVLAVRRGRWKLIGQLGSGGFISKPSKIKPEPGGPKGQLYNLAEDIGEQNNLWKERPEKVRELSELLEKLKKRGRSRN